MARRISRMLTLGIETSCDETSAAVVNEKLEVLSNVVLSQDEIHAPYGGVVPELASRKHILSVVYVVEESLRRAGRKLEEIDLYAATQGPGLIGSLLVGLTFAKGLAMYHERPLVPVDHLEAHIHSVFLENRRVPFPGLALLVSGGHTTLFLMEKKFQYRVLGRTRDDAAGEALDKIAKFLGLGYPGGPVIDRMAEGGDSQAYPFTLPRMSDLSLDFSFSGLKTAALRTIRAQSIDRDHPRLADFLASFEAAVIRALLTNVRRAAGRYRPRSLVLCGGVARNRKLRRAFEGMAGDSGIRPFIPSPEYCTDNAAMVAALAVEKTGGRPRASFPAALDAYPKTK